MRQHRGEKHDLDIQKEVREVRKPGIVYAKEVPMIKVKQVKEINGKGTPLKEDIDIVRKKQNDLLQVDLKNGLDESTKKVGVYFNERNGEELQNVDHVIFEKYVEVEPNTTYTMWSDIGSTGTMKLCNDRIRFIFYNSNKEFKQGFNNIATVKTSENTRYIRVSMPSDYFGRTILKKGTEQPICDLLNINIYLTS